MLILLTIQYNNFLNSLQRGFSELDLSVVNLWEFGDTFKQKRKEMYIYKYIFEGRAIDERDK